MFWMYIYVAISLTIGSIIKFIDVNMFFLSQTVGCNFFPSQLFSSKIAVKNVLIGICLELRQGLTTGFHLGINHVLFCLWCVLDHS